MEKDINKNRTKNILRNICISTVILFFGIIIIAKSFKIEPGFEDILYSYTMNKNVIYKVKLIENDFFENDTLEMNKTYISSLVDKINMDFSYTFSGNKKANTKYLYQVVAVTNVKYASTDAEKQDSIWNKQYVIVQPKEMEVEGSTFSIKDNFDVDFARFNDEVKKLKEELRLPAVADLQVKIVIRSDTDVVGIEDKVVECSILNMKMDLAKDVFTVENDFKNAETKNITTSTETRKEINKVGVTMGGIIVFIAVLIMLDAIRKSIKFSKKSDYAIALNRILKNYGDIVAEIVSPVEIDNLNVIDVKNFDQLLDIEEEIRMPILFYETIADEQGEFIIICDNMAYRYVIG